MASHIAVVLLFGLLFAAPMAMAKDFDFYFLVLMWPGAYCQQSGCCLPTTGTPANDFFIKGFWTYNSSTESAVTKCTNAPFYVNDINALSPNIYEYWSNIKCPSNNGKNSWKSAWKTYGVCSNLTEIGYFDAALKLNEKLHLLSLLAKKGIKPDYNLYKVSDIKAAIAEGIGGEPLIQCSVGAFKKFQLYQIYVCADKDASTIIECPFKPSYTCSESILFHPFREWMLNKTSSSMLTSNPIEMPVSV